MQILPLWCRTNSPGVSLPGWATWKPRGVHSGIEFISNSLVSPAKVAKVAKSETTKTKEKTACQYCEKPYVFIAKHETKCSKKPQNEQDSSENGSIAIKA